MGRKPEAKPRKSSCMVMMIKLRMMTTMVLMTMLIRMVMMIRRRSRWSVMGVGREAQGTSREVRSDAPGSHQQISNSTPSLPCLIDPLHTHHAYRGLTDLQVYTRSAIPPHYPKDTTISVCLKCWQNKKLYIVGTPVVK